MSGERGRRVKFWLFIAASLFLFWFPQSHCPLWLSSTANEQKGVLNGSLQSDANVLKVRELKIPLFKNLQFLQHSPRSHCESFGRERMANAFRVIVLAPTYSSILRNTRVYSK